MAEVEKLRRGNIYEEDNQLWRVLEHNHIKMGRGGATVRLRLRNVRTGSTVEKAYNNGTRVKDVRLDSRDVQYLYNDGEFYYFMDTETFDQFPLTKEVVEGVIDFMVDNTVVTLESYENEPLSMSLPTTVDLKVIWAEGAVAGDTANTPSKQVELETGYKLQVPMFVNEGDMIRVDTRNGEYVTRILK